MLYNIVIFKSVPFRVKHTFVSFIQANPEGLLTVKKYFQFGFNETLLRGIFNTGKTSSFTNKQKQNTFN